MSELLEGLPREKIFGENAEEEEERAKVTARSGVTWSAVRWISKFRSRDELRLTDMDGRRDTEDTVVAGSDFTRQATTVSQRTGTWKRAIVGKVKRTDERIVVGCGQDSEKEHGFLSCEAGGHLKNTEEEQRPVQTKTSSQKRRTITCGVDGNARPCLRTYELRRKMKKRWKS